MGYFSTLIEASFHPNQFWTKKSRKGMLWSAVWFYGITVILQQIVQALVAVYNLRALSAASSQVGIAILSIPFFILGLLILAGIYHGLAKLLNGHGKYVDTLIAVIFSSGPMIIPNNMYLKYVVIAWVAILLSYGFYALHRYPWLNAVITAAIPSVLLIFLSAIVLHI